jgi:hypothetical protein
MLIVKAEIKFTIENKNYSVGENPFRPAFSFKNELIFSGDIVSDNREYLYNREYTVDINFFTIDDTSFPSIEKYLEDKSGLVICAGRKILGYAKVLDFSYT